MKRSLTILAAVLVASLSAGQASAQYPPQSMPMAPGYAGPGPGPGPEAMQYGGGQQGGAPNPAEAEIAQKRYGLHPFFSKVFHRSGCNSCNTCGKHGRSGGGNAAPAFAQQPANLATGGTLAFPHHQFVRSPRDYFMAE